MARRSLLRPLLRWISLAGSVAVLALLGAAGTHQRHFTLFLGAVVGLSAVAVAIFVATAPPRERADGAGPPPMS